MFKCEGWGWGAKTKKNKKCQRTLGFAKCSYMQIEDIILIIRASENMSYFYMQLKCVSNKYASA